MGYVSLGAGGRLFFAGKGLICPGLCSFLCHPFEQLQGEVPATAPLVRADRGIGRGRPGYGGGARHVGPAGLQVPKVFKEGA